jgi:hypothetical protein
VNKFRFITAILLLFASVARAQEIRVSPSDVTAYSQGATSVFLTFSGVGDKRPVDACWCGELISAAPDVGFRCNPAKVFGCLPVRYDRSRRSGNSAYTDIMSIPPTVARRAYLDAASGAEATFFYVRRFTGPTGGADEYVPVTIRLSGNGASLPFSLTGVKLTWGVDKPVLFIKPGEKLPAIKAEITYTGTGRLKGRWEIVKPGDEMPSANDLLTEATLPVDERAGQRRYRELSRFSIYLPPGGKFILPGPENWRIESQIDGLYLVLLRVEATDDRAAGPTLEEVAGSPAAITTGAVAGFPLPFLRYYVGSNTAPAGQPKEELEMLTPADGATVAADEPLEFRWAEIEGAALYRLEITDSSGGPILQAVLLPGHSSYRAPSWLKDMSTGGQFFWRLTVIGLNKNQLLEGRRRSLRILK